MMDPPLDEFLQNELRQSGGPPLTLDEFLKKREEKSFTPAEIAPILEGRGYMLVPVSTGRTQPGKWTLAEVKNFREKLQALDLPYFSYIKFYRRDGGGLYALVAGKTNSWNDDVHFENVTDFEGDVKYESKDKAKKWLCAQGPSFSWYCGEVLIVYPKEAERKLGEIGKGGAELKRLENLALSVEADIMGLFGLFGS